MKKLQRKLVKVTRDFMLNYSYLTNEEKERMRQDFASLGIRPVFMRNDMEICDMPRIRVIKKKRGLRRRLISLRSKLY